MIRAHRVGEFPTLKRGTLPSLKNLLLRLITVGKCIILHPVRRPIIPRHLYTLMYQLENAIFYMSISHMLNM